MGLRGQLLNWSTLGSSPSACSSPDARGALRPVNIPDAHVRSDERQRGPRPVKIGTADIFNPKQETDVRADKEDRLFPYYAGYSKRFAVNLLRSLKLSQSAVVFDPWNGSGTTTRAASELGMHAVGCDLNPVMVLIAKADLISPAEAPALIPLAAEILASSSSQFSELTNDDPLCKWLVPNSARFIRTIERRINKTLVSSTLTDIASLHDFAGVAPVAAVMYLALFRTTRRLLSGFLSTNPTWIKSPAEPTNRLDPAHARVADIFNAEAAYLSACIAGRPMVDQAQPVAKHYRADSTSVPLGNSSVDLVLTSPPYCTRIDYAMATAIELAVLGVSADDFSKLRRSLLGNATVGLKQEHQADLIWGDTCLTFLDAVRTHSSVASSGYYYKNHFQYFAGLSKSVAEVSRVLKSGGVCVATVQDSHYKEVHNNLPLIFSEMCVHSGMTLERRVDFPSGRSMGNLNTKSLRYRTTRHATESVLVFKAKN